jgi:CheY-like chemotaxis protein
MKSINILLIEDNEGDILLTREAFEESRLVNKISVIKDGKQAISFFESLHGDEEIPDLVLLDLNLPKANGQQVLTFIKNHQTYKKIPVIMMTTSSAKKDIIQAYNNHANCYITKPIDLKDFMVTVNKIEDFWVNVVTIPNN